MEKEIEEMAKAICHAPTCKTRKNGGNCYKYCNAYIYAFRAINAGYQKVEQGEWVKNEIIGENYGQIYYQHKNCKVNETQLFPSPYKHCPNCGAKMKGE